MYCQLQYVKHQFWRCDENQGEPWYLKWSNTSNQTKLKPDGQGQKREGWPTQKWSPDGQNTKDGLQKLDKTTELSQLGNHETEEKRFELSSQACL